MSVAASARKATNLVARFDVYCNPVANLGAERAAIVRALDLAISGI